MTLADFIREETKNLENFENFWYKMNGKEPENFPLDIPDDNSGIWEEQFLNFCGR